MLLLAACGTSGSNGGSAAAPTAAPASSASGAAFDWKTYQGTQIRLLADAHPWTDTIKPQLGDFEQLTGIHVVEEDLPETQFRQKLTTELSQGTGSVDVMMSAPNQEGLKYEKAGWYQPLDTYIKNPSLTSSEYDYSDFAPATINIETVEGKLIGIPIQLESEILFYRKDLFEQKNLTAPATFDDLVSVAKALHSPDAGVFGIGLRGNGAAATSQFSSFLYDYGANWTDQSGKPTVNTAEAINAFTYYGNLARMYGPPNSVQNSWPENVALFQQGKMGMFCDATVFKVNVEDQTKSQVVGKVGYAVLPKGPVANDPASYVWGLSIAASSKHKEAAWYFVQWATSKAINLQLLQKGVPVARQSPWQDPAYSTTSNKEFDQVQQQSVALSKHSYNPDVVPVQEFRDAVGPVIVTAIQGGDVKAAADTANAAAKDVLSRAG